MKTPKTGGRATSIVVILLIIIIAILCVAFIPKGNVEAPTSGVATTSAAVVAVTATSQSSEQPSYTTDVETPVVSGLADATLQKKINGVLSGKVSAILADFQSQAVNIKVSDGPGTKSNLEIKLQSWSIAKNAVLTVRMEVLTYFSGAAHPITVSETSNFDLLSGDPKIGEDLELIDVFETTNGVEYLKTISDYSTKDLKVQLAAKQNVEANSLDLQFFAEGADSNPENFSTFSIESAGIRFIFGQYQVAPYVFGEQEVLIPYSLIGKYMKKDGLTEVLVK